MTCVVCGAALRQQRRYDFRSDTFRRVYTDRCVYRCTDCNLSQVDMGKVDKGLLDRYYVDQYRVVANAGAKSDVSSALWQLRADALVKLAGRHFTGTPTRIFEVGAGYGVNLKALGAAYPGAELFTDEVSEVVEQSVGVQRADLKDGPFGIVLLSHVLEHFADPIGLMDRVVSALAPGGIVVIEVPNDVDDIVRYNGSDEPHLTFFERATLRSALDKVRGLEVVELFAAGPSVTRLTMKRRVKTLARSIVYRLPVLSGMAARRGVKRVREMDFAQRNDDGLFLRAVLRKV